MGAHNNQLLFCIGVAAVGLFLFALQLQLMRFLPPGVQARILAGQF
jgi:hypothetical protein